MTEREQLEQAIVALEAQRATLGDAVVDASIAALREKLATLVDAEAKLELQGERKLVTIMFADISGFTALAETMDPEAVRDLMNACFERLVPPIEKYGGTVDKFIGDEIMALFGAPVVHENDPERALRAALDMMDELAAFNLERETNLSLHFGINTGLVIAGGLGTREQQEYSVMGDAVNLAARLEDASERDEIFVGPDTHRLTAPLFEFEPLDPVRVKGKAEPVPVYRLLAVKAVRGKVRGITGLESPLVGRETEFHALQEAVECLQVGVGGIITLMGEAGLGKSRLVAELGNSVRSQRSPLAIRNLHWVEGRCLSYGGSIAYLLWVDVLRGLLGVTVKDPPLAVRGALRERVQTLCAERFEDVYPYLGRLLSLPLADEYEALLQNLEGEARKRHTFRAVESLIECAARQRPLVVICEDLHWADSTSIELLEQLLALTDRAPLLFLCVFRPEKKHACWRVRKTILHNYGHRHTDLWLDPLSTTESQTLVGNLLRVEGLPDQLRERILSHAEGNPFYVEEIIRSLMDSGAIAHDESTGQWIATRDVADIAIPDTLHGVLMARIDRLQEETKRVLQLASVVGRIFFYRVLAGIAREKRQLDGHLLTLQREEMIRERARTLELEYIFKHQLTQEAAYNGLLKKERRVFHRQVAEALERLFPERIEEQVGLLAYHWERAEEPEKATEYLLRAGDQARLAYAHQEAIDYYRRALVFLKELEEHERAARTLMKLGLTYHSSFDFQRARQTYDEGFGLWQRAGQTRADVELPPAPHALRVRWIEPQTLDPAMSDLTFDLAVMDQLFCRLVDSGPEMNIVPGAAQSWEVSKGGQQYVFHLRDDVYWSDSTPVTAGDFEFAWKRILDPTVRSPRANMLYVIKGARAFHRGEVAWKDVGVRAIDKVTLLVELQDPIGHFLYLLTSMAHPVPRHVVEAHGEAWTKVENLVSSGPFKLQDWKRGESMVLVRNPGYYGRFEGNVQRVELSLIEDQSAALEMYAANDLDILDIIFFSPAKLERARQRYAGDYVTKPMLSLSYVRFDTSRPPFDDVRVRRAFTLATDREKLAGVIRKGMFFPATGGFVPPGMPGHSAGIGLPHDPEQARQLLAEAGYPGGRGFPVLDVLIPPLPAAHKVTEYMQAQWRENLGIEILWQTVELTVFTDRARRESAHVLLSAWAASYPDPDDFLDADFIWEESGWRNAAYEGLVEQARRTIDQVERMKLYGQADRILVEEAAFMPLFYWRSHLLVKPWVTRYPTSAIQDCFWKDVVIEPH